MTQSELNNLLEELSERYSNHDISKDEYDWEFFKLEELQNEIHERDTD